MKIFSHAPSVHLFSARANITNEEDKEEQKEE